MQPQQPSNNASCILRSQSLHWPILVSRARFSDLVVLFEDINGFCNLAIQRILTLQQKQQLRIVHLHMRNKFMAIGAEVFLGGPKQSKYGHSVITFPPRIADGESMKHSCRSMESQIYIES